MTIVDVQVVVAAGGVSLQVKEAERQHDHVTFWDSDVPDAFAVGFVEAGETFTGHDARVCDQVASTEEDWP